MAQTAKDDKLFDKLLEIVSVMSEVRTQLNSFIASCSDKDVETQRVATDLGKRLSVLEISGSEVIRELLKAEKEQVNSQLKSIEVLRTDVDDIKEELLKVRDVANKLANETSKKNWRNGIIISFISIIITLVITLVVNHIISALI
jgi:hypothetical protein